MSSFSLCRRSVRWLVFCLAPAAFPCPADAAEVDVLRTNLVPRWITNTIHIYLPDNRFVNVYQTNLVQRYHTNFVDVFRTNTIVMMVTNQVVIDVVQTNWFTAYQTNWRSVNLTNWTPVTVTKTGEIPTPVNSTPDPAEERPVLAAPASFRITAFKTDRSPKNSLVEVLLKVADDAPVQVEQWRVQSLDGTTLVFDQDPEFKRELQVGKYVVELKAKPRGKTEFQLVRGNLTVTERDAWIQYKPLASR